MRVFGVDFTSAPSHRKPIMVASGRLNDFTLAVESVESLDTLSAFTAFLSSAGPWVAGIDFPFGQPRKFVENIGWPLDWRQYVRVVADMTREQFVTVMRKYQQGRPQGDIRHFRVVDRLARSCSPMQLDFVPVAQMFYEGAPRILQANCSVYPFYSVGHDDRIVVEAYPALVARKCIGSKSYKTDEIRKQTGEHRDARQTILEALNATTSDLESVLRKPYGLAVEIPGSLAQQVIDDGGGDKLDAILCAVQAAWADSRRGSDVGMNKSCDLVEGWIADPELMTGQRNSEYSAKEKKVPERDEGIRDRAGEFISLLNRLTEHLRSGLGADKYQTLFQLLRTASDRNAAVRRFQDQLKDYGDLRNAIVHDRAFPGEIVAEPTEKTIVRLRSIVEQILSPRKLIPAFQREIRVFRPDEPVVVALRYMKQHDFSQVVVRDDQNLSLLTTEGIAGWVERQADEDIVSLLEPTIADALACEVPGAFLLMSRNQTIYDAREAFANAIENSRPRLYAIILTNTGRSSEAPLGIITPWNILAHST